jgi:hypothetical protein
MTSKRATDLPELTSTAPSDFVVVVDVSNNADDPAGSSRKVQLQNLIPGGTLAGPENSVDGNLVEFADTIGATTRDSGVKTSDLATLTQLSAQILASLPWVNVKDFGAIGDGATHPLSAYYATLAAAQVDFPQALSLSEERDGAALKKAIQYCVDHNLNTIYTPSSPGGGYYRFNTFIDFPYTPRNGFINMIGDGGSADTGRSPTWVRTTSAAGFRCIGQSLAATGSNQLMRRINFKGFTLDGGWGKFDTSADYPVLDVECGYEDFWDDFVITQSLGGVMIREVMDSRFNNVRVTWCGQHHGYQKAMTMTNGSPTVTVADTTGIYAGQRVYGTGVTGVVRVASITNSTTMVLTANANFTGTRKVAFEKKAPVTICSTNNTAATSNNLVLSGWRIENCAGMGIRIQGQNIIDIFMDDMKIENNTYAMDYMLDVDQANGVFVDKMWVFSTPSAQNNMEYPITTSGKTITSMLAAGIDNFTIPGAYQTMTGTATQGSAVITGLSDTSTLFVGQSVDGFAPFNYQGTYIKSIDSSTQITITEPAQSSGTKSLTFSIYWNFGVFYTKQMSPDMPIMAYDTTDPRNYVMGRVTDYVNTTGVVTWQPTHGFGDTSKSITSWKLAACTPGMVRFGNGCNISTGCFIGGQTAGTPVTSYPYLMSFIHLDGVDGYVGTAFMTAGERGLPYNSFMAMKSSSNVTQGTGTKTFTIPTGLPADYFPVNGPVYISVDNTTNAQNQMEGTVTSYDSGTGALVCNITSSSGVGTYNFWRISPKTQPLHLRTGTNTNIRVTEKCLSFGSPAPSSHAILPLTDEFKNTVNGFSRQQYAQMQILLDAANIAWDLDVAQAATVTLTDNRTLANPTNMKSGASYTLIVKQDGTGSRTLSYGTAYEWPGGVIPALSTDANAVDIFSFICDDGKMYGAIQKAFG